jgi:hypothetical protein
VRLEHLRAKLRQLHVAEVLYQTGQVERGATNGVLGTVTLNEVCAVRGCCFRKPDGWTEIGSRIT